MSSKLTIGRRGLLPLAAAASCAYGVASRADTYPDRTITFTIPDGIGGGASIYVRKYCEEMSRRLKVNVEPYNEQGANGQKAVLDLAAAAPDGYYIGMLGDVLSVQRDAGLLDKLTWIANLGRTSFGLAVNVKSGIRTVADLQALGRRRPVTFTSTGKTALSYFAAQLFCKLNDIPCKMITGFMGSEDAMVAVSEGQADATAQSMPTVRPLEASGLLKTIFTYQAKATLPNVEDATSIGHPELADITQYRFVAGPPGLPPSIVSQLTGLFKEISDDPATIAWSKQVHVPLYYLGPDDTKQAAQAVVALYTKWKGKLG